ncbi:YraN family protein [Acuticoccus kandeliae]|uniref:YraN family protein n=1 Tax=Acuticoccus kandeliae TaxID=2073160 RepID=UPI000D3E2AD0|nr:YraN family protein [Acuticoccus kandeliae]
MFRDLLDCPAVAGSRPQPKRQGAGRSPAERRRSHAFGMEAEGSVARYLHAGGYHVIGQRRRTRSAEVDLVAVRDDMVAFVEVKARKRGWDGLEAVNLSKQRRLSRAASEWLAENPAYAGHTLRFDIALVWPGARMEYLENAFEAVEEDDVWR